jgi:outer membrane protein OmpA-like peptidoglycan-associated protein
MSKTITSTLVCLLFSLSLMAQEKTTTASNFLVHITAFNEKRPLNYFDNLTNVVMKQDNKGIWHYYLGTYKTLEEADSVRRTVLSKGYPYTYVIDVEKVRRECKLECDKDPSLDPSLPSIMQSIRNTSHLLFDFGKNQLRPEAKTQLNRLAQILSENNKFRVEFKGHTDNIGSTEFNLALSEKRANAASDYLKGRSIPTDRIKLSSYGKDAPIAKNQKEGKDCPQGRKFNRRVEIFITDIEGNVLNALVEPLDIPTELLAEGAKVKM